MANSEHLARLAQGVTTWNPWREANVAASEVDLRGADLRGADLQGAALNGVDLRHATLNGVTLRHATLNGATLRQADLRGADLSGATLFQADLRRVTLTGAMLPGAFLVRASLIAADLRGADLRGADLRGADGFGANLHGADLRQADLRRTDLSGTDLSEAHFGGANLTGTQLRGADLRQVILSGARLRDTVFEDVTLADVIGLGACRHDGPSVLEARTLQQSGPLPLSFLQGCGLPDRLIACLPHVLQSPMQYAVCFIRYASKDQDLAHRLHADLQASGVRCWLAPDGHPRERPDAEPVDEAIPRQETRLLILSKHSMSSEWIQTDLADARRREVREQRPVLFLLGLAPGKTIRRWTAVAAESGTDGVHPIPADAIVDFSQWTCPAAYQPAFEDLLQRLTPALERQPAPE